MDLTSYLSEDLLQGILKYSSDGIIVSDSNGVILCCNPAAEKIFDYLPNELLGQNIENLFLLSKEEKDYYHSLYLSKLPTVTQPSGVETLAKKKNENHPDRAKFWQHFTFRRRNFYQYSKRYYIA